VEADFTASELYERFLKSPARRDATLVDFDRRLGDLRECYITCADLGLFGPAQPDPLQIFSDLSDDWEDAVRRVPDPTSLLTAYLAHKKAAEDQWWEAIS
jgi:hypothetical protein